MSSDRGTIPWRYLLLILAAAYTFLYLVNALAPEISPDGSAYHLGLVARYFRERGFHRLTTNMYANLSQGVEMLFLFAFTFGRHSAAAMFHFAFFVSLPAAMILYARRAGFAAAGMCAALFVYLSPIAGIDGISAYNDAALAAIAFGVFYLLEIWDTERQAGTLIAIGLLAGFAYAVKYTGALAIPYAVGFIAWKSAQARKPVLAPMLIVAGCAAAMMMPWLIKNAIWVHNPFSPFLNGMFPNPYIHVSAERDYSYDMRHYEAIRSYAQIPWALAVDGRLNGTFGPLFLLAPIGLLAARSRAGRRWLLAAMVFGATYFLNIGARFLIPALAFVAMAMALALVRWPRLTIALVTAHAILSWPAVTDLYASDGCWRLRRIPIRAALRLEQEDAYLDTNLPTYRMARLIEHTTPPGATLFALSQVAEAYTTRNILVKDQAAGNQVLGDMIWTPMVPASEPDWLQEFRFPETSARRIRVRQTAVSKFDQWSISELRVYRGEAEMPRAPGWGIGARPNPWEIALAFDGLPVTRWRTWDRTDGREFVEIDFGQAVTLDRVALQCSRDEYKIKLRLEALASDGQWRVLADHAQAGDLAHPAGLRRMAAAELKRRGVDYIVVYHFDFGTEDLRDRASEWGIKPVGVQGEDRIFQIGGGE